jgi:hypothetical protein
LDKQKVQAKISNITKKSNLPSLVDSLDTNIVTSKRHEATSSEQRQSSDSSRHNSLVNTNFRKQSKLILENWFLESSTWRFNLRLHRSLCQKTVARVDSRALKDCSEWIPSISSVNV